MKQETYLEKMNKLLGIAPEVVAKATESAAKKKANRSGDLQGITEEEIQDFRQAQGIIYFLQAPELFTPRTCKRCSEPFLVSRRLVAYCSYNCIKRDLAEVGINWTKGNDIEALVKNVYEGNEPIWISKPGLLERCLTVLQKTASSKDPALSLAPLSKDLPTENPSTSSPLTTT